MQEDRDGTMTKPPLSILLAGPRGFCAGVDRAIEIVEMALEEHGAPVYVRHEIVHNRHVVDALRAKGAIFVDEVAQVPDDALVIFSAHGVPKRVPAEAKARDLLYADATCPLVSKVHREVERHHAAGRIVILVGHAGHPEVEGTMGQVPDGCVRLVESEDDVDRLEVGDDAPLAFATQTTLSVADTAAIVERLKRRFPNIEGPRREDICYATTNRQGAIAEVARRSDAVLVVGAPNSSNSQRLVEVAKQSGCDRAWLIETADQIDWAWLDGVRTLGLTAGASAPEILVQGVVAACQQRFEVAAEEVTLTTEDVIFRSPPMPTRRAS